VPATDTATPAAEPAHTAAPPQHARCPYCGQPSRDELACDRHVDLVPLDIDWHFRRLDGKLFQADTPVDEPLTNGWLSHELRPWWLERYTLAEIRDLAAELGATA